MLKKVSLAVLVFGLLALIGHEIQPPARPLQPDEIQRFLAEKRATLLAHEQVGRFTVLLYQRPVYKECAFVTISKGFFADGDVVGAYSSEFAETDAQLKPVSVLYESTYVSTSADPHTIVCIALNDAELRARTSMVEIELEQGQVYPVDTAGQTALIVDLAVEHAFADYAAVRFYDQQQQLLYVQAPPTPASP